MKCTNIGAIRVYSIFTTIHNGCIYLARSDAVLCRALSVEMIGRGIETRL